MADLWSAATTSLPQFAAICERAGYENGNNLEALLSRCQLAQIFRPEPEIEAFVRELEALIVQKCRFVADQTALDTHETFLRKVARRSTRQPRTRVFTTNYDLCFETAAARAGFVVVDGFSHTQPQEFDGGYFSYDLVRRDADRESPDYIPSVFHLHKMHGSVDWEGRGNRVVKTETPSRPLIIYPRHSKFEQSYAQPFFEMMSRFQAALRQPNTGALVIGVGFNDDHIWQPLLSAVRSNVTLKLMVVDPALQILDKPPLEEIGRLIRAGDSRLGLLSAGFEDLVPVLPDLVSDTEHEAHRARVRKAGVQ